MRRILSSDQVNYMIWRYLQESGFQQSAIAFQNDSKVNRLEASYGARCTPGLLIYLIQRGLLYEELATTVDRDGSIKPNRPFTFFPSSPELIIDDDEGVGSDNPHMDEDDGDDSNTVQSKSPATTSTTSGTAQKHKIEEGVNGVPKKRRRKEKTVSNGVTGDGDVQMVDAVPSPPLTEEILITNGPSVGVGTQVEDVMEITAADTLIVEEGENGIISCAWNPVTSGLLATASGALSGAVARIWTIPENATSAEALVKRVLSHQPSRTGAGKVKVTAVRWSPGGDRLASGTYDGQTRIWTAEGALMHNMLLHCNPILCLKWNKSATFLLALSVDGKIIAWNTNTGDPDRVFDSAKDVATDIEWISDSQFIGCGENGNLYHYDIGVEEPLYSKTIHDGEIRCITWDEPTESIASGGADASVMIWHKPSKDTYPEWKLQGHTKTVVQVAWQPGDNFIPAAPRRILASASDDTTVRLWEVMSQQCVRVLSRHADPIEKICFSPGGQKLASGANGAVLVWNTDSGALTHVYDRSKSRRKNDSESDDFNAIAEISWDEAGQRLAIGEGEHKVVLDGGHIPETFLTRRQCAIVCINTKPQTTT